MNETKMYDYLVVGAGLFGTTFARCAADAGKRVLVIDRRNHIAGNAYTKKAAGILVHKFGPHIFHTSEEEVWKFLNRFGTFNTYVNMPKANYKGTLYSLPFNMNTFHEMWGVETPEEAKAIIESQKIQKEPENLEEQAISLVGRDIYETLVKGYTEKQWGRACTELPPSIIKRLPVRFCYDNNYFNAAHQGIPVGGYTKLVEAMLSGIEVRLNTDYLKPDNQAKYQKLAERVIFTGPIDEYFGYCLGHLEYRSVEFKNEILPGNDYQSNAVINYTDREIPWTRIIEHKWFNFGKDEEGNDLPGTVISREFSKEWKPGIEPYYPIGDEKNQKLYEQYRELAVQENGVFFGGRLGEYKYYDMDQVVLKALALWKTLGEES